MKPLKSLLFLFGAIAVLSAAHFLLKRLGHEGFSDWESTQPAPVQQSLHERWQQDSLMLLYQRIYRFPEHAPSSARLQDIPLAPFQYDTTGAGRRLLRQFFAKLLMLSHPEQAQLIQNCYPDPVFWNENLANNRPYFVRILCYEGAYAPDNRISGTLRQLIQSDFGGSGPGIIPLSQPASSLDPEAKNDLFRIKTSDTWHEVASATDTRRGNFGIMTYYLGPPPLNALATASHSQDIGQIRIDLPPVFQNYPGLCMEAFVHEDVLPKDIKISISGNSSRQNPKESSPENILPASVLKCPGQQRLSYPLPKNTQNILLQLVLKRNRNLYAIAFNDTVGVSVDNIFLPRNKGKVFSVNNRRFLTDQMLLANVGLILYQPALSDTAQSRTEYDSGQPYHTFRLHLLRELSYIRSLMPSTPVVLIATQDSSPKSPNSPSDTPDLIQIQKETAFQTACIFWNPAEMLKNPDLADIEKTNLNGRLFYKALLDAYRQFLQQERREMSIERARHIEKSHPVSQTH